MHSVITKFANTSYKWNSLKNVTFLIPYNDVIDENTNLLDINKTYSEDFFDYMVLPFIFSDNMFVHNNNLKTLSGIQRTSRLNIYSVVSRNKNHHVT